MRSCYRSQREICSKKKEDISVVQNKKEESAGVLEELVEEEVYLTAKITTDITGILCAKEV